VDGYSGYDALFRGQDCPRIEVGCWMHARRYFVQAVDAGDLRALPAVAQIRALYGVEREAKEAGLDAEGRRVLREQKARPLLRAPAGSRRCAAATPEPWARRSGCAPTPALLRYLETGGSRSTTEKSRG
jgi:hypothetical protein